MFVSSIRLTKCLLTNEPSHATLYVQIPSKDFDSLSQFTVGLP